jgi:BolA protein
MKAKLAMLQPSSLELVDDTAAHKGHAGAKGFSEESHFDLRIVAECFGGLSTLKRHKLVYTVLGESMDKIHALQVKTFTAEEAAGN